MLGRGCHQTRATAVIKRSLQGVKAEPNVASALHVRVTSSDRIGLSTRTKHIQAYTRAAVFGWASQRVERGLIDFRLDRALSFPLELAINIHFGTEFSASRF